MATAEDTQWVPAASGYPFQKHYFMFMLEGGRGVVLVKIQNKLQLLDINKPIHKN